MRIPSSSFHNVWDNSLPPVVTVEPGDVVELEVQNASGGQIAPGATTAEVVGMDFTRVNPVTGPVAVAGAEPGDALVVDVLDIACADWGWTANIPGFGLLADDFPDPHLVLSEVREGVVRLAHGVELPSVPMIGTIGMPARRAG